jgi:peptidoglycan-associated lipoprotein
MKKRLTIVILASSLLIMGCAQKKVDTIGVDDKGKGVTRGGSSSNTRTNVNNNRYENGYENVDLYERGGGNYSYDTSSDEVSVGLKNIYFSTNQYNITSNKLHIVRNNAKILKSSLNGSNRVKIEGHCDASGTDEYNYALGLRRAKSAKDAVVDAGISNSSITVVSMGESSPECTTGYSSACYAKNRRVEFKVIR